MSVVVNSYGVNKLIKANILSDEKMRKIGFRDYFQDSWYFHRRIKFPNTEKYRMFDISFIVTIPKDNSDIQIDVIDENSCLPYDYQYMLDKYPTYEPCLIVKEQVEEWMKYLQDSGVLSGHNYGDYI